MQNLPFCKPSTVVEYCLPLNMNGTLAPSCVSLIPVGFYTVVVVQLFCAAILLRQLSFSVWRTPHQRKRERETEREGGREGDREK